MRVPLESSPAWRSALIRRREVLPRIRESSTTTTRLPCTTPGTTASFMSTLLCRCSTSGMMNVRPT